MVKCNILTLGTTEEIRRRIQTCGWPDDRELHIWLEANKPYRPFRSWSASLPRRYTTVLWKYTIHWYTMPLILIIAAP